MGMIEIIVEKMNFQEDKLYIPGQQNLNSTSKLSKTSPAFEAYIRNIFVPMVYIVK